MSKMPDYERGKRDGMRWAITWLHERAKEMNEPKARQILNAAAFCMGVDAKDFAVLNCDGPKNQP